MYLNIRFYCMFVCIIIFINKKLHNYILLLFQTTFTIQIKLINKISMYILWRFLRVVSSWCASPACLIYRLLWFADINSDKTRIQFGFLISHIEPCARIAHSALQFSAQLHSRTISISFCSCYQMRIQSKKCNLQNWYGHALQSLKTDIFVL